MFDCQLVWAGRVRKSMFMTFYTIVLNLESGPVVEHSNLLHPRLLPCGGASTTAPPQLVVEQSKFLTLRSSGSKKNSRLRRDLLSQSSTEVLHHRLHLQLLHHRAGLLHHRLHHKLWWSTVVEQLHPSDLSCGGANTVLHHTPPQLVVEFSTIP